MWPTVPGCGQHCRLLHPLCTWSWHGDAHRSRQYQSRVKVNAPTSVTSSSRRPQVHRTTLGCLEHPLDQLPKLLGRKGFAEDRHISGTEEHRQA